MSRNLAKRLAQNWRLTPATLAYYLSGGTWIPARHLVFISAVIASALRKGNARIIIEAPPRHGKTEFLSSWLPVWILENFPNWRVLLATYGADLATEQSRKVRDRIQEHSDKLRTKVRSDVKRADQFLVEGGGGMYGVGVGGAITGRGANVLLIDDYVKNDEEAASETRLEQIWDWFRATAFTRLEPGGSAIILATRWDERDLIGRLKKKYAFEYITDVRQPIEPRKWYVISLEAIAEKLEKDPLRRDRGEALWPERYDVESLLEIRDTIGSIFFQALYQQDPHPMSADTSRIEHVHIVDGINTRGMRLVRAWDFASSKDSGDYTVGALCGAVPGVKDLYLLDIIRAQVSPGEVRSLVRQVAEADGIQVQISIPKDPGAAGASVLDYYKYTILPEYHVVASPTNKNKVIRANPLIATAESGHLFLQRAGWNDSFLRELSAFPDGDYDDQVDAVSDAHRILIGSLQGGAIWGREPDSKSPSVYVGSAVWGR